MQLRRKSPESTRGDSISKGQGFCEVSKRDSFLLRLQPETLDALRRWAEDDLRSMNSQIEFLLKQALEKAGRSTKSSPTPPSTTTDSPKYDS